MPPAVNLRIQPLLTLAKGLCPLREYIHPADRTDAPSGLISVQWWCADPAPASGHPHADERGIMTVLHRQSPDRWLTTPDRGQQCRQQTDVIIVCHVHEIVPSTASSFLQWRYCLPVQATDGRSSPVRTGNRLTGYAIPSVLPRITITQQERTQLRGDGSPVFLVCPASHGYENPPYVPPA